MPLRWSGSRSLGRWFAPLALTGSFGCSPVTAATVPYAGPQPAKLAVEATQGATVHVDGVQVGTAPLPQPVEADPGPHHLAVTLDGHHPQEQRVVLERGRTRQVSVELKETAQRKWAWASMGIGGAGVATGIVFGVLSVVEHRAAQDLEVGDDATDAERAAYDDAISARDTYRVASGVSAGAGIAIFLTGAVLFAFDVPEVPRPDTGRPSGDVSFTPWLGPGVVGGAARVEL